MRVVAILRGFPGLGRVIAGIELLDLLQRKYSAEVHLFTYMQGALYARSLGYESNIPTDCRDLSSIGIIPVSRYGESIIERIANLPADLVIIDGEPLFVNLLKLLHVKCKIISLLNPFDIRNPSIQESTSLFFKNSYSKSDITVVHGLWIESSPIEYQSKEFHSLPTILRSSILSLEPTYSENRISCILGGGTENATQSFFDSTLSICHTCIQVAERMGDRIFDLYCGSQKIANALIGSYVPKNMQIHTSISSADELYLTSKLIITRAGRNTLSELLYLGMPTIAFPVSDPHRGSEQNANLMAVASMATNMITDLTFQSDVNELQKAITALEGKQTTKGVWEPGNQCLDQIV